MIRDVQSLLAAGLGELGVEPPSGALRRLCDLSDLVASWGQRINLTGHRDPEAIARRLVLDAAALGSALPGFASLADLGSGAGFPGLPLAILRPDAEVILVEARERRHHFQRHAIRSLGLENVRAVRGRIETADPHACEVVVAQAVAGPDRLAEWMLRWAAPGAILVVPGGTSARSAPAASERLASAETRDYRVPLGGPQRTLWVGHLPSP